MWNPRVFAVLREVPCSALKGETVPDSLPATPKSPPTPGKSGLHARGEGERVLALESREGEIKRRLLLGRKVMTNLDSIFKTRDITLPTKVCLVKAMVFLVVTYGCESWTVKKAEHRRIDAFELWC